ncbi:conserved hypothetical protein [Thermotomaculum hydrothermale]|uniref:DAGKc domain-containing protein n=1 Tax=Thermotomaculum hydrothermale TaxID=981385 RepID=A0A7R6PP62_9BACT|nr:diacylglycerol kinase family protein [Thermotomaculum hydrothermale]BBB33263.1 conserved hypothetical protein [Thermotomaculum hydrothermale]
MKALLIFNPKAANGRAIKNLKKIQHLLLKKGIDPHIKLTECRGHGIELVEKEDLKNYDAVLSAGGDGTLFETLNGLFRNKSVEKKPPIGIIPIGTGNAFVRDMNLKTGDFESAIEIISNGKKKQVDVGKFTTGKETYYYLNIVGLGFVSDVNGLAHKLKIFGNISYSVAVFIKLIPLHTYRVKLIIDGKEIERENIFVEVSNSRYTSNFLMAPDAKIDDGYLDITLLNKTTRRRMIAAFPKIFTGEHIKLPEVETFKAKKLEIITEKNKILTPDGEMIGTSPVKIECLNKACEVFWR